MAKAYGSLPPAPRVSPTIASPLKPASQPTPLAPTKPTSPATPQQAPPDGWIAVAGFNDAAGLGSDRIADSPYPLGKSNVSAGQGEPGWAEPWSASPQVTFQKEVVHEGDGAAYLTGTVNFGRQLLAPQTGVFRVEQYVRVPAGGGIAAYIWRERNGSTTGPMWRVRDGKFGVMNGNETGDAPWLDVGPCKADVWYKVTVVADVPKRHWEFMIDDKKFERSVLGFRTKQTALQGVNYLVDTPAGAYLDAIRVGPAVAAEKPAP